MNKSFHLKRNKSRPNRANVHLDIYDAGVYVIWPVDSDGLRREYLNVSRDDGGLWPEGAFDMAKGKFLSNGEYDCIAFSDSKPPVGIIAHEAYHYAMQLGEQLGLKGQEAHAYIITYVTERIYELTRK